MFRISRLQELVKLLPRGRFERAVEQQQANRYRKGFDCWQHLISMVYAQLAGVESLRTLVGSFNAHTAHHYHLNCGEIRRSTLGDANAASEAGLRVFTEVAQQLMQQVQGSVRQEGEQLLHLLDSTSFTLKGAGFDEWTAAKRTRQIQGLKLHVLYGLSEQAPLAHSMSAANVNDIEYTADLVLQPGITYVFDRGYYSYHWWWRIEQSGARFVSRFKGNVRLQVVQERSIAKDAQGIILKDQQVRLSSAKRGARRNPYTRMLRRIEVAREGKAPLVLVSNDFKSAALKLAEQYRARWQIELFFKWIKQHLRIKRFLGRSERAVRIQILTALIAYLLVRLYALKHRVQQSQWLLLNELRATLFQRADADRERHRRWRTQRALFQSTQQPLPL